MTALNDTLDRFMALHPKEIDLTLERVHVLLEKLGNPQKRIGKVIQIAGTNGKGSTGAFLRSMLEADGHLVHAYSSPHLVRFNERVRLAASGGGQFVDEGLLLEALQRCEKVNDGLPITFFEITTAAAFLLFAEHRADYTILEVGLGGRLDATNVIDNPVAVAITPIAHDHERFLGDTIEAIATEKAGLIGSAAPVICARQEDAARDIVERRSAKFRAPFILQDQDFTTFDEGGRLIYQDTSGLLDLSPPRLVGHHQFSNAGLAIAVLRAIGLGAESAALDEALLSVDWPGRMQPLAQGTLIDSLPKETEVWLDGGHNPNAGAAIATTFADLHEKAARPLTLICGMLTSKEPVGYFEPFHGLARHVYTVPVTSSQASFAPKELAATAREAGLDATACATLEEALSHVNAAGNEPQRLLLGGSLYLAGEVLEKNGTLPE